MFPSKMPGEDFINSWYPILIAIFFGVLYAIRTYFRGGQCRSDERLNGKIVVVTGANTGVGKEIAKDLARRGARVILACRDEEKGKEAIDNIKEITKSKKVDFMKLDLASFKSVRDFVKTFNENEARLDILINNAGVICHPKEKTTDGNEIHFQVNYLGHFLLTHLLLDKLKESAPSRIINTSALAYQLGTLDLEDLNYDQVAEYKPGDAYAASKLAIMLFTRQLSKYLEGSNVTVNAVHPGIVNSYGLRHMPFQQSSFIRISFAPFMWFFMKPPVDGAQTTVHCAVAKEEEGVSGKYYIDCYMSEPNDMAKDDELAQKLWDLSLSMTDVKLPEVKDS